MMHKEQQFRIDRSVREAKIVVPANLLPPIRAKITPHTQRAQR